MAGKPIKIAILANGRQARAEFGQTASAMSKVGSAAKRIATGSLLVAGAAVTKFGIDSVKSASASQQSIGATESVFGKFADTVIKRSEQAAEAIGLSANEYRELSNVTGAMLASAGTPLRKVADLTDDLNERAADMAATFGGTTREAVESISSLLRGETDPIEKYGVAIKQSDVKARLAAKGLEELEGKAKKQAEQQARLELLFKQTAKTAGQFGRESNTLAGQQQRLGAKVEDLEAKFGKLLLPALTDAAEYASDEVVPALEDLADWLGNNKDEFVDAGNAVKDSLLPPLETLVDVGGDVIGFVSDLPQPLKEIGIQAGVAAAVLPRFTAGVGAVTTSTSVGVAKLKQFRAEMTYSETRSAALSGALGKMGQAARGAAGIGGMVALTQGARTSNDELQALANIGGGAMLGFASAGPIGAAIGGGAGLVGTLAQQLGKAEEGARKAATSTETYAGTLDDLTGSVTQATRAMALKELAESGAIKTLGQLGISQRDAVNAAIGQKSALEEVTGALSAQDAKLAELRTTRERLVRLAQEEQMMSGIANPQRQRAIEAIEEEIATRENAVSSTRRELGLVKQSIREKRREIAATRDYSGLLKGLPKNARTRIKADGVVPTNRAVARLARRYNLTPKQIRTLIKATGIDASVKDIRKVQKGLRDTGNVKPQTNRWRGDVEREINKAKTLTRRGSDDIKRRLELTEAKPDLVRWQRGLQQAISGAKGQAASGATGVGNALKSGLLGGMYGTESALSSVMSSAVAGAIASARRTAKSRSPSRETMALGRDLGRGLELGVAERQRASRDSGADLVRSLLGGMTGSETYARRVGSSTADALARGFGAPAMEVYATATSSRRQVMQQQQSPFPERLTLVVDGHEFSAYVRSQATGVARREIDAHDAFQQEQGY